MRRFNLNFLIILFLIVFCSSRLYAGELINRSKKNYMLYVPKKALSGEKSSVLVCLPGWGVRAKSDIHQWTFPAEKNGFVVVEPDIKYYIITTESRVESLYQQIVKLVESISLEYPLDTDKIYIAGTSAGGMMSISLALMFPDKFKAIGVVSGGRIGFFAENHLRGAKGSKFYMIHGKQDKSIKIGEFYSTKKKLERNGALVEFKVLPKGRHTLSSSAYKEVVDWMGKVPD